MVIGGLPGGPVGGTVRRRGGEPAAVVGVVQGSGEPRERSGSQIGAPGHAQQHTEAVDVHGPGGDPGPDPLVEIGAAAVVQPRRTAQRVDHPGAEGEKSAALGVQPLPVARVLTQAHRSPYGRACSIASDSSGESCCSQDQPETDLA